MPLRWSGGAAPRFTLDPAELAAAFSPRTRLVVFNHPHNPTGVVFDDAALARLAELARAHDAVIVADEVYEHLVFAGPHRPMASFAPERTIALGSAGKTFSVTGWKVGWAAAPAPLAAAIEGQKQWLSYSGGAPFQPAVAHGLGLPDAELTSIAAELRGRRDLLCGALTDLGCAVAVPDAGYFVIADVAPLGATDATAFCRTLPERCGVVAIPVSAFCSPGRDDLATLVRFAYCKDAATLAEAAARLRRLRGAPPADRQ